MPPREAARPAVALVGTGRLARALVEPLQLAGYPLAAIAGRRRAAVGALGRGLNVGLRTVDLAAACSRGRLILLAVADSALPGVASTLSRDEPDGWRFRTVLHFAGALGPAVLAPLAELGAAVGVLHPLQCLGSGRDAGRVLPGSRARIEGDPRARRVARRLASDLGLTPLRSRGTPRDADRSAYHAAASLASNDLVALLWDAEQLMTDAGFPRAAARDGLVQLVRGTLEQIAAGGPAAALSGPVPRGDLDTLRRHLDVLDRRAADLASAHRGLALRLAALAAEHGNADARRLARRVRQGTKASSGRTPKRGV